MVFYGARSSNAHSTSRKSSPTEKIRQQQLAEDNRRRNTQRTTTTRMAPLPIGRIIAQLVVPVIAVLARAIPAAYAQAVQNAKKNGVDAAKQSAAFVSRQMAKDEALMVLNLSEKEATADAVQKVRETNHMDC